MLNGSCCCTGSFGRPTVPVKHQMKFRSHCSLNEIALPFVEQGAPNTGIKLRNRLFLECSIGLYVGIILIFNASKCAAHHLTFL